MSTKTKLSELLINAVQDNDLQTLESICMLVKYKQLIDLAKRNGIDLDALEEMLVEIS